MRIIIDHTCYTSLGETGRERNEPHIRVLFEFLREWFDERPYVVGHTSGSTGRPKEIRLLKTDMESSARITNDFFHLGPDSRLLLCLSPSYIAGKLMIVRALTCGGELITRPVSSVPVAGISESIDLAALVPMQVQESLNLSTAAEDFGHIRQMIIGGAPVDKRLQNALGQIPTACFATYGMTETVSHIALQSLNGSCPDEYFEALGKVRFEQDARGCLVIRAPHLQQQTFLTNDLVQMSGDRRFRWLGRYDYVINSGGIKLSPEEIEKKLNPLLDQPYFITSRDDERLGQRVVLVVESAPWTPEEENRFHSLAQTLLSRYELPREIVYRNPLPRTDSGKILRSRL